jgi:hypothetical protein
MFRYAPIAWAPADSAPSAALEAAARALEVVPPHERRGLLRDAAAVAVDRLLVRVARSRGALDVALCEGLAALADGERLLRLGWSGPGDYARERLGVAARTAQAMVRLGRALRERPLLRDAVRAGRVSVRAAQAVLPVARGEAEAAWVERARGLTVRALEAAVRVEAAQTRAAGAGPAQMSSPGLEAAGDGAAQTCAAGPGAASAQDELGEEGEEAWQRVVLEASPSARAALDEALEVAGRLLGASSPRWQRLEAVAQEFLGAHPHQEEDDERVEAALSEWRGESPADRLLARRPAGEGTEEAGGPGWREALEARLEVEAREWVVLDAVDGVVAPEAAGLAEAAFDPAALDEGLRRLAALRDRWDGLLGHLALLVRLLGLWREAGYASFRHYVRERLGLGLRSVEQRVALERRLYALPGLGEALRAGRVSAERARLVARVADEWTEAGWIERAQGRTCVELRREVEALEEAGAAQTRAPAPARLEAPVRVARLVAQALQAARRQAREAEGRWLDPSECLERVALHFVAAWAGLPRPRSTPRHRALDRDRHRCQVPGCSRAAAHAHHVRFRSHGGADVEENLVGLCAAHHLAGVHRGWLRVRGEAPDRLVWELVETGRGLGARAAA